jgi:hypothetical protein
METRDTNQNEVQIEQDKQGKTEDKFNGETKIESWGWTNNIEPMGKQNNQD